nr:MAG TPA: hypothetical protein [Caudoviricetes sp.]
MRPESAPKLTRRADAKMGKCGQKGGALNGI